MNRWTFAFALAAATFAALSAMLYRDLRTERALRLTQASAPVAAAPAAAGDETIAMIASPAVETPATAAPAPAATPAKATATGEPDSMLLALENQRARLADPAVRAAMLAQHRVMIEGRYPNLAADLGLSAEQADRLFELLARQFASENIASMEADLQLRGQHPQTNEAAMRERRRMQDQRQEGYEAERQALLGEEIYKEWRDYQNSREARGQLQELRGRLADSASPLHASQMEQLVPLLTAEQQRYREELRTLQDAEVETSDPGAAERQWGLRVDLLERSQQRTLEAMKPYMDAEQLQQFRRLQEADLKRERSRLQMWRASRDFKYRGAGT